MPFKTEKLFYQLIMLKAVFITIFRILHRFFLIEGQVGSAMMWAKTTIKFKQWNPGKH